VGCSPVSRCNAAAGNRYAWDQGYAGTYAPPTPANTYDIQQQALIAQQQMWQQQMLQQQMAQTNAMRRPLPTMWGN